MRSTPTDDPFSTEALLIAQYGARAIIPIEYIARDYFGHLSPDKFKRKISACEIDLPIVRLDTSQKGQLGVHLKDLAAFIDKRREAALKEQRQMNWRKV